MNIDEMNLPKVNEIRQDSTIKQDSLKIKLYETILQFQKENNYFFEPCEINNVLLQIVQRHNRIYLNVKFGFE